MEDGNFLNSLLNIGVIKYGKFTLKTGMQSPIYITFRDVISYPEMMEKLADLASDAIKKKEKELTGVRICGVPYGALSLATLVSVKTKKPLLICRKEGPKAYGQKRAIEGVFNPRDECLIIDDVLTSGTSILEVATALRGAGLVVKRTLILLDRCQGGIENLAEYGIEVEAIYTLDKMLEKSLTMGVISEEVKAEVDKFLVENKAAPLILPSKTEQHVNVPFARRCACLKSALAVHIADIILDKRTNLCLSADVRSFEKVCSIANDLGDYICALKLHTDMIEDFPKDGHLRLKELAKKHRFVLFEDRKYCDIGNTVAHQYGSVAEWADLVTAHGVAGPGTLKGIQTVLSKSSAEDSATSTHDPRGVLLVAEMSSSENLADKSYTEKVVALGEKFPDLVVGFICQSSLVGDPGFLYWTPGVKLEEDTDNLGQQYRSPDAAVHAGADVIIVGRGIYEAQDPVEAAKAYAARGFEALMMRKD